MSTAKKKEINVINFTIDGKEVQAEEGWTVLETARHYQINIPTLCYHEAVKPSGACRFCVVEAREGDWSKIVASCMYPPWEGLEVLTDSERVKNVRRWILEMLVAECPASDEIQALAAEYGVQTTRFNIDDLTGFHLQSLSSVVCREDAFVQTERSFELLL